VKYIRKDEKITIDEERKREEQR